MAVGILGDAARLLASLAGLGQQFGGPSGLQANFGDGEYLASSVTSLSGDALAGGATIGKMVGPRLYNWQLERMTGGLMTDRNEARMKKASDFQKSTSLILWTMTVVEILELTTGFGPPAEGDDLKAGAHQFSTLSAQLKSALPDNDSWEGSASEAYADLDSALQTMATTMAELDNKLADLVKDQAEWVTHMRLGFGVLKDVLIACYIVELIIQFTPSAGPAVAKIFAGIVCALGIAAALSFLGTLLNYSIKNGQQADSLAKGYEALATGTVQEGSMAEATVATSGQSTVGSFDAVSNSMSGMSALSATPPIAAPAKADNRSEDERAPLGSQMSAASGTLADAKPETPDKTTPSTPAVPMPTVGQLAQMSGQASKLSGQLSQHSQLVNQAMGQIQQLAQLGQQGQGAAAPAEEAELADDVEGAGAGLGTEGAERAPIDVAATDAQQVSGQHVRVR
ncbi:MULTISPECIES: EspA/EspE family type VII secretion system effector [unclassified Mycobacterium]|uniref:EspA/EspE family type VII secretion system effector n=1 Tax=unclassified Mycobacterium TaxID=2642494 RepID=UPI00096D20C2|nr:MULTISPECIES: EspA/EspE family type VII secretion system effector [unclassified Mycobacterium]OMC15305.1 hypothetical protein A5736_01610 [Mycobacterium sp. SP-6446]OMC54026.1 hypothetical protein A5747_17650 [Mycobacterium sp. IS-836]